MVANAAAPEGRCPPRRRLLSYAVGVRRAADLRTPARLLPAVRVVLVLAMFALAACDESLTAPTVGLNQEFVLAPGEAATIATTGLRIRFVGVRGDSRCPADAVCILGGDAIVAIEVLSFGGGRHEYDLHTGDLRPVVHEGFAIALVKLEPYPFSSQTIQPNDYRATLRVTR
jgi:hypothetical protein